MLKLRELQTLFRQALAAGDTDAHDALLSLVDSGELSAEDRIAIYVNNVTASLTDVLKETFPAVCRLI